MAKVNYVIYDDIYSSANNDNMKFRLVLRAYDDGDHIGIYSSDESQTPDCFINGAIDSVDISSDWLGTQDVPQSQHKILRAREDRVISGYNYHMIESLANSCDVVGIEDYHEMVTDNKDRNKDFFQYYSKQPDTKTVYVKSYVSGMLVDSTLFNLTYNENTTYTDQGPIGSYITAPPTDFSDLQQRVRNAIQDGSIIKMLKTPDEIYSTYSIGGMTYKYAATWQSVFSDEEPYTATLTFNLDYGTDDFDTNFRTKVFMFDIDNYDTADDDCTTAMNNAIADLKDYLDGLYGPKLVTSESNGTIQETSAYSSDRYRKRIAILAHGTVPNYDGTVRSLLQFDTGLRVDEETGQEYWKEKGEVDWVVDGSVTFTNTGSKFGQGLELRKSVGLSSTTVELGGQDFTVDFFLFIKEDSTNGSTIFNWNTGDDEIELYYDSGTKAAILKYKSTLLSTATPETPFNNTAITDQSCHYAIVYRHKDGKLTFFIDGYLVGEVNVKFERVNLPVYLNRSATVQNCGVEGTLDEFRLSDGIARWKNKAKVQDVITTKGGTQWRVVGAVQKSDISPYSGEENPQGIYFDGHSYAELLTPYELLKENFSIDFWCRHSTSERPLDNPLSIDVMLPDGYTGKKPTYLTDRFSIGMHCPPNGNYCIHSNYYGTGKQTASKINKWCHVAIVYTVADNRFYIYYDGKELQLFERSCPNGLFNNDAFTKEMIIRIGYSDSALNTTVGFFQGYIDCITVRKNSDISNNSWKNQFKTVPTVRNDVTFDSSGNKVGDIIDVLDITAFGEDVDSMIKTITPVSLLNQYNVLTGGDGSKSLQDRISDLTWEVVSFGGSVAKATKVLYGNGASSGIGVSFASSYIVASKDISLGGDSFTIEGWYNIANVAKFKFLEFKSTNFYLAAYLTLSNSSVTFDLDINGTVIPAQATVRTGTNKGMQHFGIVYVHRKKQLTIYLDGEPRAIFDTEKIFSKTIIFTETKLGLLSGDVTKSFALNLIEFRILNNWALWLGAFKTNATPYTEISFPVIDLGAEVGEEEDDDGPTIDGSATFKIPDKPYDAVVDKRLATGLLEYHIPLTEYFDDFKFTPINKYPHQIDVPTQDDTMLEPKWEDYDPDKMTIGGTTSASLGGQIYYAEFTPKEDYVWRNGSKEPKKIPWIIEARTIDLIPSQGNALVYDGNLQFINLINLPEDQQIINITGEISATDANNLEKPYYYVTATLKQGYSWPDNTTEPKKIRWRINPKSIKKPVLNSNSSLSYVYDGTEKSPSFIYDSNFVEMSGTTKATNSNATNNGTILQNKEQYTVVFKLKNSNNTCWAEDNFEAESEDSYSNDGSDDIEFSWIIKRQQISTFTVGNTTTFIYVHNVQQGPDITPSTWDSTKITVSNDKKEAVGNYDLTFALVDINNYEWSDGSIDDHITSWKIEKAPQTLTLTETEFQLKSPPLIPTKEIDLEWLGHTNDITITNNDYVTTTIGIKNHYEGSFISRVKITVAAKLNTTEPTTVTITVAESDCYLAGSITFTCTVLTGLDAFTWQEIADMTADGTLMDSTFIGDSKAITLKDGTAARMILIGYDHNAAVEGSKRAHFMFGKLDDGTDISLYNGTEKYFVNGNTSGGWNRSDLKLRMSKPDSKIGYSTIFPDDFLTVTTAMVKWSDNIGNGSNEAYNFLPFVEYVTLPSQMELFGSCSQGNSQELVKLKQYDYFKNGGLKRPSHNAVDNIGFTTRTISNSNASQVVSVNKQGNSVLTAATNALNITPIFTVSKKQNDIINLPEMSTTIETLMHFDDEGNPFKDECGTTFDIINKATGERADITVSNSRAKFNKALQFDGTVYGVQKVPFMLGSRDFTIDFWVYYDNTSSNANRNQAFVFYLYSPQDKWGLYCHRTANATGDASRCTTGYYRPNKSTIWQRSDFSPINSWHHIALVYEHDHGQVFIYWDGKITTNTDNDTTATLVEPIPRSSECYLYLGTHPSHTSCMVGAFDELRIINGTALWKAPNYAYTRRPVNAEEAKVFDPPTNPNVASENFVIHDQPTDGLVVNLSNRNKSRTIAITGNTGQLQVLNSHPAVATATLNGQSLVISGLAVGTTKITLYTLDTDTTTGTVCNFSVNCDASIAYPALWEATPEQIKEIVKTGHAADAWQLGDQTADIPFVGTVDGKTFDTTIKATLIGIDHNKDIETQGCSSAHFMFEGFPTDDIYSGYSSDGFQGWINSHIRNTICEQFRNCLPVLWRNLASKIIKWTACTRGNDTVDNVIPTEDRIWLLAFKEINENYAIAADNNRSQTSIYEFDKQQRYKAFINNVSLIPKSTVTRSIRISGAATNNFCWSDIETKNSGSNLNVNFCFAVTDYSGLQNLSENESIFKVTDITYDGNYHNAITEGYIKNNANAILSSTYYEWYGNLSVVNVQTNYSVTIKPALGFAWSDGTTTPKIVNFKIVPPATEVISLNKSTVRLYYKNSGTDTVTVTRNNDSDLSVQIADTSLVRVQSISGNMITFEALGTGRTTATITSPTKGNYGTGTATLNLNVSNKMALSNLSYNDIQEITDSGYADICWDVGDTMPVPISGAVNGYTFNHIVQAVLIGINHNSSFEGNNRLHFTLGKVDSKMITFEVMDKTTKNAHKGISYPTNIVRTQLMPLLFSCLPVDLRTVISACKKQVESSIIQDLLWSMSLTEILGSKNLTAEHTNNQQQYEYYSNGNSKVRYGLKNLNSASDYYTRSFMNNVMQIIGTGGAKTNDGANNSLKLSPCFTIGSVKNYRNLIATENNVNVLQGYTKDITLSVAGGTPTVTAVSTNTTVASATVSNKKLTISGIATGTCQIILSVASDNDYETAFEIINVTVGSAEKENALIAMSASNVSITPTGKTDITATVTGGTISSVTSNSTGTATASVASNKITITGVTTGTAIVTISVTGDSTHNSVTKDIYVTVSSNSTALKRIPQANSTLTIPSNAFDYNGENRDITTKISGFNSTYHRLSGVLIAKNHKDNGDYTITIEPIKGYQWYEGGTQTKTVSWNINRIDSIISGTTSITLTNGISPTAQVTYTKAEGMGIISVQSNSNSSLLKTVISGNTITYSSTFTADQVVTIVLTTAQSQNYNSATLTVTVTVQKTLLQVIPAAYNKDQLSLKQTSSTYSESSSHTFSGTGDVNNFSDTYHSLTVYYNNTTPVASTGNVGSYVFQISPKDGYVWDTNLDKSEVELTYTLERKKLSIKDPVQIGLNYTDAPSSYTGNSFSWNGKSQTPVFILKNGTSPINYGLTVNATAQTNVGSNYTAQVTPTANYAWSDGTYNAKSATWKIDIRVITKPSGTLKAKDYEQGVTRTITISNDITATDDFVTVTGQNYIATAYSNSNKITTAFPVTVNDTTVRRSAENAGNYNIVYTLKNTAACKWSDNTTAPITLSYTINRLKIDANEVPEQSNTLTVTPKADLSGLTSLTPTWKQDYSTGTTAYYKALKNNTYASTVTEAVSSQVNAGSYTVTIVPTANYCWNSGSNLYGPIDITWTIQKANAVFSPSKTTLELSETKLSDTLQLAPKNFRGALTFSWSVENAGSTSAVSSTNSTPATVTVTTQREGTAKLTISSAGNTNFNPGSVDITVKTTVNYELPMSAKEYPIVFTRNLWKFLMWNREDYAKWPAKKVVENDVTKYIFDPDSTWQFEDYTKVLDKAIKFLSGGSKTSAQSVVDDMKKQVLSNITDAQIKTKFFIDLTNNDQGSVFGKDFGASDTEQLYTDFMDVTGNITSTVPGSADTLTDVETKIFNAYTCLIKTSLTSANKTTIQQGGAVISEKTTLTTAQQTAISVLTTNGYDKLTADQKELIKKLFTTVVSKLNSGTTEGFKNTGITNDINVTWAKVHRKLDHTTDISTYVLTKDHTLKDKMFFVMKALKTWWFKDALRLINTYYGLSADSPFVIDSRKNLLYRTWETSDTSSATTAHIVSSTVHYTTRRTQEGTDGYYEMYPFGNNFIFGLTVKLIEKLLDTTNKYGKTGSSARNSIFYTICHEMIHYISHITIPCYKMYRSWFTEGFNAEALLGADSGRAAGIRSLAKSADAIQKAFDAKRNTDTGANPYAFGYMFSRFLLASKYCAVIPSANNKSKLTVKKSAVTYDPDKSYTITGSEWINNFNSKYHRIVKVTNASGKVVTECKDAGTYTIHISPEVGYVWDSNKNFGDLYTLTWTINKANSTLTIDKTTLALTETNWTDTVKVTSFSAAYSGYPADDTKLTYSLSSSKNTFTIRGVHEGTSKFNITIPESTNYKSITKTVTVTLTITYEIPTKQTPWVYMRNAIKYIQWHRPSQHLRYELPSAGSSDQHGELVSDHNYYDVLDGMVSKLTNGDYKTCQAVINVIKTLFTNLGTNPSDTKVQSFLKTNFNIDISNNDIGLLWGYDMSASTSQIPIGNRIPKTGSIVSTVPTGDEVFQRSDDPDSPGITVKWPSYAYNTDETKAHNHNTDEQYILRAAKTWWIPVALKFADQYYGLNDKGPFTKSTDERRIVSIRFYGDYSTNSSDYIYQVWHYGTLTLPDGTQYHQYGGRVTGIDIRLNWRYITNQNGTSNMKTSAADKNMGITKDDLYYETLVFDDIVGYLARTNLFFFWRYPYWFRNGLPSLLSGIEYGTFISSLKAFIKAGSTEVQNTFDSKATNSVYYKILYVLFFKFLIKTYVTDIDAKLPVVPTSYSKTNLTIKKSAETYNANTTHTITGTNWINNFNSTYHVIEKVTNASGTTMSNNQVKNAGTYTIYIKPATGYTWDSVGDISAHTVTWTINRQKMSVATGTQTGLSGSGTAMTYTGSAQTPTFDIDNYVTKTVTGKTNVGTYSGSTNGAKLTPTANYAWSDGTTTQKTVSWTINRKKLATSDNPVFKANSVLYTGSAQKPTADNFTFDSTKMSYVANSTTVQTAVGSNYNAVFAVTANYAWSDGTTTNKNFTWAISSAKLAKPSVSGSTTFTYNGKAQGPTISNNITATNTYITVTAENYLAIAYTTANATTTGFSTTANTTVQFTATDAGRYSIKYTPKSGVTWSDGTSSAVVISYTINKAVIATSQVPVQKNVTTAKVTINYDSTKEGTKKYSLAFKEISFEWTNDNLIDNLYTIANANYGMVPATYNVRFIPTKNYKWHTSTKSDNPYGILLVSAIIQKCDLPYYLVTSTTLALSSSNNKGDITFFVPSAVSSTLTEDFDSQNSADTAEDLLDKFDVMYNSFDKTALKVTGIHVNSGGLKIAFAGNTLPTISESEITLNVASRKAGPAQIQLQFNQDNMYFNTTIITLNVNTTVINDSLLKAKPYNFMRSFFRQLNWNKVSAYSATYSSSSKSLTNPNEGTIISDIDKAIAVLTGNKLKTASAVLSRMKILANNLGTSAADTTVNNHLKNNYLVDLTNTDAGAIFGQDVGASSTAITEVNVIAESGNVTSTVPTGSETINGIKFNWPTSSVLTYETDGITPKTTRQLSVNEKYILKCLKTWWLKNALNACNTYYGLNVANNGSPFGKGAYNEIDIQFYNSSPVSANGVVGFSTYARTGYTRKNDWLWQSGTTYHNTGYGAAPVLQINSGWLTSFTVTNNTSGKLSEQTVTDTVTGKTAKVKPANGAGDIYLDTVIAHEMVHALGYLAVYRGTDWPDWFKEGSAELLIGIDNEKTTTIRNVAKNATLMQNIFDGNGTGEQNYAFGYLFLRYLIKNYCTKTS